MVKYLSLVIAVVSWVVFLITSGVIVWLLVNSAPERLLFIGMLMSIPWALGSLISVIIAIITTNIYLKSQPIKYDLTVNEAKEENGIDSTMGMNGK